MFTSAGEGFSGITAVNGYAWDFDSNIGDVRKNMHVVNPVGSTPQVQPLAKRRWALWPLDDTDASDISTINAMADFNGRIVPSGPVSVTNGENKTFTIIPENGYEVADVVIDGQSRGAITSYEFNNVNNEHDIQVTFRSRTSVPDVVFIDNVGTQRRLRANDDETDVIGQGTQRNGRRGQWKLVDAGNGYYFIENVRNRARLQAVSNAVNNEESIRLSNGGFGSWVQWELVPVGNNFLLQNRAHNTNLNVNNNLEISAGPSRLNGPGVQWKLTEVD